jgi:predicted dithiol-disulfide oxidoreductase (DUF899 family)
MFPEETLHIRRKYEKKRDTTFVVVSRAPLAKLDAYKAQKRWSTAWFSSFGSDFNYDFHVTLDPKIAPAESNYRNKAETEAAKGHPVKMEGEQHGLSVFFSIGDDISHTYSVYARGCESLTNAYFTNSLELRIACNASALQNSSVP